MQYCLELRSVFRAGSAIFSLNHGKKLMLLASLLVACLISGCHQVVETQDQLIYSFPFAVGVFWIIVAVAAFVASYLLSEDRRPLIAIVLGALLIIPQFLSDKVVVTADGFTRKSGFWFFSSQQQISFKDCLAIRYVVTSRVLVKGKSRELHCIERDGNMPIVVVGDLMAVALPEIRKKALANGVSYQEE